MSDLLVFSHLRWSFVYQRPQHLMSRLAADRQVFFVEEPVFDRSGAPRLVRSSPAPGVQVLVPHTPIEAAGFHDDQLPVLQPLLQAFLRQLGPVPLIAWFYTPMALPLIYPCDRERSRSASVACIRDWLSRFEIVLAGRYAEWEYYNSDHAFLAGRGAAATVRALAAKARDGVDVTTRQVGKGL